MSRVLLTELVYFYTSLIFSSYKFILFVVNKCWFWYFCDLWFLLFFYFFIFLKLWVKNQLQKSFEGWQNESLTTGKTSVQNLVWMSQRYRTFWPMALNSQSLTRRHTKCYWDGPGWCILQHMENWKKLWKKFEGMILLFGCLIVHLKKWVIKTHPPNP